MKTISILLSSFLLFTLWSCEDEVSSVPTCCDNPPLEAQVGNGTVYLPNVFTPNGDGSNDLLFVYADSAIALISSFEVWSLDGLRLFEITNISPNNPTQGWDAGAGAGLVFKGLFEVRLNVVSTDGSTAILTSTVCSFPCENPNEKEPTFDAFPNCVLADQFDGSSLNATISSAEPWPCLEQ
ncbi:MAG: hypothetical protein AAGD05_05990 [Bacteroidota bacterium]